MPSSDLIRKFEFGANLPLEAYVPGTVESQLTVGAIRRDQLKLAYIRAGVEQLNAVAVELGATRRELASELRYQSSQAQRIMDAGFNRICDSLYELQDTVRVELSEIRWLLADSNQILRETRMLLAKPRRTEARELVEQGRLNFELGFFERSIKNLTSAIELDNTDFETYMCLGFSYVNIGDIDRAIMSFSDAAAYARGNGLARAEALLSLSRCYYCLDDWDRAIIASKEVISEPSAVPKPLAARARYLEATYLNKAGKFDEAIVVLNAAIGLCPNYLAIAATDQDWEPNLERVRGHVHAYLLFRILEAKQALKVLADTLEEKTKAFPHDASQIQEMFRSACLELEQRPTLKLVNQIKKHAPLVRKLIVSLEKRSHNESQIAALSLEIAPLRSQCVASRKQKDDWTSRKYDFDQRWGALFVIVAYVLWYTAFFVWVPDPRDFETVVLPIVFFLAGLAIPFFVGRKLFDIVAGAVFIPKEEQLSARLTQLERALHLKESQMFEIESSFRATCAEIESLRKEISWTFGP